MRLLILAFFFSAVVAQAADGPSPAATQDDAAGKASHAKASQHASDAVRSLPFRMPASERKNIADNPSWTTPQAPFRIYGNTWFVGPHGLGVFLITAQSGDVLIDGGIPGGELLIESNVRALGVDLRDIKWILISHAHSDHAGGVAQLAQDTGAQVIAGAADVPALERGGRDDPHYGNRFPWPPVRVSRGVSDGEHLRLGDLELTAYATPGHTKGNTTWAWRSCEAERCLQLVDIGSLSAPGYDLRAAPKSTELVEDFEHSFAVVAGLPCDIPLAPHPGLVNFWERVAKRGQGDPDALVDPAGCRTYAQNARDSFAAERASQRLEQRLKQRSTQRSERRSQIGAAE